MTVTPGAASPPDRPVEGPARTDRGPRPAVAACPFLVSAHGAWRSATPARDHLCSVVSPAAPLAAEKQRRLCLTAAHDACPTYLAALDPTSDDRSRVRAPAREATVVTRWGLVRTAPLIIDSGSGHGLAAVARRRSGGQVALGGLLALALAAVVIARVPGPSPALVGAMASASPAATAQTVAFGTSAPSPRPTQPARSRPPAAIAAPSDAAPSALAAASSATYTVRRGDTLYGIAIEYDTTVADLQRLNGLDDDALNVGQTLRLP